MNEQDHFELEQRAYNHELAIEEALENLAEAYGFGDREKVEKLRQWLKQM